MTRSRSWILLVVTVSAGACCGSKPRDFSPTLLEMVAGQTADVLRVKIPAAVRPQVLGEFEGAHKALVTTRAGLIQAWSSVQPATVDLESDIFREIVQDADWEAEARKAGFDPAAVPDRVFLDGFWKGLAKAREG